MDGAKTRVNGNYDVEEARLLQSMVAKAARRLSGGKGFSEGAWQLAYDEVGKDMGLTAEEVKAEIGWLRGKQRTEAAARQAEEAHEIRSSAIKLSRRTALASSKRLTLEEAAQLSRKDVVLGDLQAELQTLGPRQVALLTFLTEEDVKLASALIADVIARLKWKKVKIPGHTRKYSHKVDVLNDGVTLRVVRYG